METGAHPSSAVERLRRALTRPLPEGGRLPDDVWARRHRGMTLLLAVQAAALVVVAQLSGPTVSWHHLVASGTTSAAVVFWVVVAAATTIALADRLRRVARTSAVAFGLVACSAYLVHVTGGMSEAHLHVFVMLAVISLYEDWVPFLAASAAVALHHGALATVAPDRLFADPAAAAAPGRAVTLHLLFLAGASVASVIAWRLGEHERARADLVLDATADGVCGLDPDGRITFANAALTRLVDLPSKRLVGRHHHEALGHVAPPDGPCPLCTAVAAARGVPTGGLEVRRRDGRTVPVECGATPLWERGSVTGTVVTLRDLTERHRLQRQALHDELTGLANRTLLRAHLAQELARLDRDRHTAALLFCDLDQFKEVNDTLGHAAGDQLLVEAAHRLREAVRGHDTVARMGGDEFVVLCTDMQSSADVMVVAERLLATLAEPFLIDGVTARVSASIGVTVFDGPGTEPDALLEQADIAMYRAKQRGRDRIEVFDDELRARTEQRQRAAHDLAAALAEHRVEVRYQPRLSLADGRVASLVATPVWPHPELGDVTGDDLHALAEDAGLVEALARHVTVPACAQAAVWRRRAGQDGLCLAVPLSAAALRARALPTIVDEALGSSGLPGEALWLEVGERALADDTPATVDTVRDLERRGVRLAVAGFGTGWSSLSYLTRLPVAAITVDSSLVATLDRADGGHAMVAAALGLSRSLGLTVIADGVERPGQAAALRNLGCEVAAGSHLASPLPAEALDAQLA